MYVRYLRMYLYLYMYVLCRACLNVCCEFEFWFWTKGLHSRFFFVFRYTIHPPRKYVLQRTAGVKGMFFTFEHGIAYFKSKFTILKKLLFERRRKHFPNITIINFYYVSIRSRSLPRCCFGCFFIVSNATSLCGTMIEQHYSRRKWGEGGTKEHKAETR